MKKYAMTEGVPIPPPSLVREAFDNSNAVECEMSRSIFRHHHGNRVIQGHSSLLYDCTVLCCFVEGKGNSSIVMEVVLWSSGLIIVSR